MYLTCPKCEAIFEISESHFTDGAREVRCSSCRHQWLAEIDTSATISDLMGDEAESAFKSLNNFLKRENKETSPQASSQAYSQTSSQAFPQASSQAFPQDETNNNFRSDAISMASNFGTSSEGGKIKYISLFLLISVLVFLALFYGEEHIIVFYPDIVYIYEFLGNFWSLLSFMAIDLFDCIRRLF